MSTHIRIYRIIIMDLKSSEIIRILLKREGLKQKELAEILSEKTGKNVTAGGFAQKMLRGSISYDEFVIIADILGYDVKVEKRQCQNC